MADIFWGAMSVLTLVMALAMLGLTISGTIAWVKYQRR